MPVPFLLQPSVKQGHPALLETDPVSCAQAVTQHQDAGIAGRAADGRRQREGGAKVLLVGMRIPPNYGPTYTREFHALFGELAKTHKVALVPFFLDGIALDDSLMQQDGIHPNAAAQPRLLAQVWPKLEALLAPGESKTRGSGAQQ